jgi:hypothetical protein
MAILSEDPRNDCVLKFPALGENQVSDPRFRFALAHND